MTTEGERETARLLARTEPVEEYLRTKVQFEGLKGEKIDHDDLITYVHGNIRGVASWIRRSGLYLPTSEELIETFSITTREVRPKYLSETVQGLIAGGEYEKAAEAILGRLRDDAQRS